MKTDDDDDEDLMRVHDSRANYNLENEVDLNRAAVGFGGCSALITFLCIMNIVGFLTNCFCSSFVSHFGYM